MRDAILWSNPLFRDAYETGQELIDRMAPAHRQDPLALLLASLAVPSPLLRSSSSGDLGSPGPFGASRKKPFYKRVPMIPEHEYLEWMERKMFGPPGTPSNPPLRDVTPEQERNLRRFQDPGRNPQYEQRWQQLFSG
jgi:hypothetical protein